MKVGCDKVSDKYESEQSTDISIMTNDSCCTNDIETMKKQYRLLQLESEMQKSKLDYLNAELVEYRKTTIKDNKKSNKYCSQQIITKAEDYCDKLQNVSDFYEIEEENLLKSIEKKIRAYTKKTKIPKEECINREEYEEKVNNLKKTVEEKQNQLKKLQEDKININNQLEQEQEFLCNRLYSNLGYMEGNIRNFKSESITIINDILNKLKENESNIDLKFDVEKLKTLITNIPENTKNYSNRYNSISSSKRSRNNSTSISKDNFSCF